MTTSGRADAIQDIKSLSMLDHSFHASAAPTLGVELEFQLVDASTLALGRGIDGLFAELPPDWPTRSSREFHACCVEVNTGVCRSVDEVGRDLKAKLPGSPAAAARRGLLLAWGGTHPFSHWKDQASSPAPAVPRAGDHYRETLLPASSRSASTSTSGCRPGTRRSGPATGSAITCPCCSPSRPTARSGAAGRPACSPTASRSWVRRRGGHASAAGRLGRLRAAGRPPARLRRDRVAQGPLVGRPAQPRARDRRGPRLRHAAWGWRWSLGLTALVQCLVHVLATDQDLESRDLGEAHGHDMVLRQNLWLASRHGLDAPLADPCTRRKVPARVLARGLIDRLLGVSRELGCSDFLENLRSKTWGPTGAVSQLMTYHGRNLVDVARLMVRADSSGRVSVTLPAARFRPPHRIDRVEPVASPAASLGSQTGMRIMMLGGGRRASHGPPLLQGAGRHIMTRPLHEQSVVITGASSGIGRQAAIEFARRGAALTLAAERYRA